MRAICTLVNNIKANPNIGYLKAHALQSSSDWELANSQNVPQTGEIVIFNGYLDLQTRFDEAELFVIDIIENTRTRGREDDCQFVGQERSAVPLSSIGYINQVVSTQSIVDANGSREVASPFKPESVVYLKHPDQAGLEMVTGPFHTSIPIYDGFNRIWNFKIETMTRSVASLPKLTPYCVLSIPLEEVPANALVATEEPRLLLGNDLGTALQALGRSPISLMSDSAAVSALDSLLTGKVGLGRKGKRDFVSQLEASKTLQPLSQSRISEMLESAINSEEEIIEKLKKALSDAGHSVDSMEAISGPTKKELEKLESEKKALQNRLKEVNSDNEVLKDANDDTSSENKRLELRLAELEQSDQSDKIEELKAKLEAIDGAKEMLDNVDSLSEERDNLQADCEQLLQKQDGLEETLASLEASLRASMSQFRTEVLKVVPFFEILNTSQPDKSSDIDIVRNFGDTVTPENPVNHIATEISAQGFEADEKYLRAVAAAVISNRFTCFFSEPGSGKTTLAKLIGSCLSGSAGASLFVPVARGWSAAEDFIGSQNPFTERFDFQNDYWKHLNVHSTGDASGLPSRSIVFDEATLSPIEHYFSSFFSLDCKPIGEECEINVSGQTFCIPPDLRFLFTFNFDNSTEEVTDRVIDRAAIIPTYPASREYNYHKPINFSDITRGINSAFLQEFIGDNISRSANGSELHEQFENIERDWANILGDQFRISPRKRVQIDTFLQVLEDSEDLDYICDFASMAFLLPQIRGFGSDYEDKLENLRSKIGVGQTARNVTRILRNGTGHKSFRYL